MNTLKIKTCLKCGNVLLNNEAFKKQRYTYGKDYRNRWVWGLFCTECEKYPKQLKHKWERYYDV